MRKKGDKNQGRTHSIRSERHSGKDWTFDEVGKNLRKGGLRGEKRIRNRLKVREELWGVPVCRADGLERSGGKGKSSGEYSGRMTKKGGSSITDKGRTLASIWVKNGIRKGKGGKKKRLVN